MELCTGTLEDLIKGKCKEYTIGGEKDILLQATKGLHFLHENGIVHGNIKPTNILFISQPASSATNNNKPTIKLSDFCLRRTLMIEKEQKDTFVPLDMGKVVGKKKNSSSSIRFDEQSMNKGCWISPESYQPGDDDNNFKIDIFSLGLVFFYILTVGGKHPFGKTPLEQFIRIQKKDPSICLKKDDLKSPYCEDGNRVVELVSTMCKMDPRERPTMQQVLIDVKRYIEALASQKITDDGKTKRKKGLSQSTNESQQEDNYASGSSKRDFRDIQGIKKELFKSSKIVVVRSSIPYPQREIPALGTYSSLSPRKSPRNIKASVQY